MPNQVATYSLTNFNTAAGASQYKAAIDADFSALARIGAAFAPTQGNAATPGMTVYLMPGAILNGTALTEVGTYTTATFGNAATSATVANPAGISGTMWISGPGIAPGTTCTISGSTLTLSLPTTAAGSSAPVIIGQISPTITAPVSNPRIDRVVVSATTGLVSVITGTPGSSPAIPALTAGVLPVCQVLLQTSTTSILNQTITDERAFGAGSGSNDTEATVASASTTDLGATNVNAQLITGTTTITAFGSNGAISNPFYRVRFNNALTLTHNGTSLILPGANNITTINGDNAVFQYLGSGNWKCVEYNRFSGANITLGVAVTIASATTTDLGTKGVNVLTISGTTTITALGSTATLDNPLYFLTFSGALVLTYNASSLILPTSASITTVAGDTAVAQYLGSGNWKVLSYSKQSGNSLIPGSSVNINQQSGTTYTVAGTDQGNLVQFTGASNCTFTITAAATLGQGFYCYLQNNGTSQATLTLARSASDTIDGLTANYIMYPGEIRLIQCAGGGVFNTIVLHPFYVRNTTSGTFYDPPGYQKIDGKLWGSGAGGGSGTAGATPGGGGGGACTDFRYTPSPGTSRTITLGAGGAAATAGNNSTFGSLFTGYGGGTGGTSGGGGGGGGAGGKGNNGSTTVAGAAMGVFGAAGGTGGATNPGGDSYSGGAGGGGGFSTPGTGGNSIYGGAGGGGGKSAGAGAAGGISQFGGNGGAAGNPATAGSQPGGGGGAGVALGAGAAGGAGQCDVWGIA